VVRGYPDYSRKVLADIVAQTVEKLAIDVVAQTLPQLAVNIAAQTLDTLGVDIKSQTLEKVAIDIAAQTLANLDINLNAQTIGLHIQKEWAPKAGINKALHTTWMKSAPTAQSGVNVPIFSYVVPAGKTLYITGWTVACWGPITSIDLRARMDGTVFWRRYTEAPIEWLYEPTTPLRFDEGATLNVQIDYAVIEGDTYIDLLFVGWEV